MYIGSLNILVNQALPMVFDQSMSHLELLGAVVAKVNELITATNAYFSTDILTYVEDKLNTWETDGTLEALIDQTLKIQMSVSWYGATGDGNTDDTAAINAAITANPGGLIYFPPGTYMIDAVGGGILLNVPGTTLSLSNKAILKAITNATTGYQIVNVSAADCVIIGGTIQGDVDTHTGGTGEWGHGVCVTAGGNRAIIENVTAKNCWGDGFNISGQPSDVALINCTADSNRRQGASITDAIRPRVVGGIYKNTGLILTTAPSAGIDVEPNPATDDEVTDFLLSNVLFDNNVGCGLLIVGAGPVTGIVTGCRSIENGQQGYKLATEATPQSLVSFVSCLSELNTSFGFEVEEGVTGTTLSGCHAISNVAEGFNIDGISTVMTACSAINNGKTGADFNANSVTPYVNGLTLIGNAAITTGYNFNVWSSNGIYIGVMSVKGAGAHPPTIGFEVRAGAVDNTFIGCVAKGFAAGNASMTDSGTTTRKLPNPAVIAPDAAITTPATQGATYVQADVGSLKTAIDAIRTVLINIGLTL